MNSKRIRVAIGVGSSFILGAILSRTRLWKSLRARLSSKILIRREITLTAPIEDVYAFWKDFANYPRFMSYIRGVEIGSAGQLTWSAQGPAGLRVQWDSQLTEFLSNQSIAWQSTPGAIIRNSGLVRFRSIDGQGTRVMVELGYAPRAGVLGMAVVTLLGFDPRKRIDQDLLRMKDLIESAVRSPTATIAMNLGARTG